jgi:outer membrane biosynthesis protein TonB
MLKLTIAIAGLAAITGCSDFRDRDIAMNDARDRPLDIARAEDTLPVADSVVPAPDTQAPPRKAKPRTAKVPDPEPSSTPEAVDTAKPAPDSVTSSQPSVEPDPAPVSEPVPASEPAPSPEPPTAPEPPPVPESSSESSEETDIGAYTPYPTATPAPDTAGASPADTAVQSGDTASPRSPEPDSTWAADTVATNTRSADATGTLATGTVIHAALEDSIHSRHDVSGKVVTGRVMQNVTGPDGLTLIAAGSPVQFTVTQVKPGRGNRPGVLEVRVDSITIDGQPRKLEAEIQPISHELRGRGVTGDEAAKVAVGAAGGAVAGRVIGGNTKGAVIGGVVGAAGGAVVASKTAARDVVVKARTPVAFVLTAPLVTAR